MYVNQVVDVLADAFTLGDGARSVLQKALASCYAHGNDCPTASDILNELEQISDRGRVAGWKMSARRALESVAFANLHSSEKRSQESLARALLQSNVVVELDGLSQGGKRFLVPLLCLWLYYVKLAGRSREQLELVLVVEEAHHVLYRQEQRAREGLLEMLIRQCREIGIAVIVVDQHPHLISSAALGNTYTTICLNQKDPSDVNKAAGLLLLSEAEKRWLGMLRVGQAVVKFQDRWKRPFLVQFPRVELDKGAVTDEVLKRYLEAQGSRSALRSFVTSEFAAKGRVRVQDYVLEDRDIDILRDVAVHPHDSVRERYKRLDMSADQGTRRKRQLVAVGYLTEEEVDIGNTKKTLLRLTPTAAAIVGPPSQPQSQGVGSVTESPAHEYWKHYYAEWFRDRGYAVEVEAPRAVACAPGSRSEGEPERGRMRREQVTGWVDVIARKGDERIAIEIETGKSDAVGNARQDLLAGFSSLIVVATDSTALRIVERQLAANGLLGVPSRVRVLLRDEIRGRCGNEGASSAGDGP